jgi:hypothetical protein
MIDDKKIDDAAYRFATSQEHGELLALIDGYKKGYKDAINDFLKDLLHPANEEPKEGFDLVYINKAKEFREISSYNSDRFNDLFGNGWEAACRRFGIYKWAYKDDLLPKKGGE